MGCDRLIDRKQIGLSHRTQDHERTQLIPYAMLRKVSISVTVRVSPEVCGLSSGLLVDGGTDLIN